MAVRPSVGRDDPGAPTLKIFSIFVNLLPLPGVFVSERGRESLLDPYIGQYGRRLYGLCRTLCRDPFDADDLYQETWLKALRHWDQYDTERDFEPWVTRICVNTYRSTLRRMIRSPVFPFHTNEEKDAAMEKLAAPEKEDYAALYAAIDQLPEKLRVTVILFYFRDMDIASVSAVLGMPAGTVKSRLHKARKLLREVLGNETDLRF